MFPQLPPPAATCRPRQHVLRTMVNAILYVVRSGCAWRLLPREFSAWKTVSHSFRYWRLDGTWIRLHTDFEATRERLGRRAQPHAAIIDSQSAKLAAVGGPRGYDGAKKLTWPTAAERHLLVETQRLVLQARVHPADLQERAAVPLVLEDVAHHYPQIDLLWADPGYTGSGKAWIEDHLGWPVSIVPCSIRRRASVGSPMAI